MLVLGWGCGVPKAKGGPVATDRFAGHYRSRATDTAARITTATATSSDGDRASEPHAPHPTRVSRSSDRVS
jgi:hypothetical protein